MIDAPETLKYLMKEIDKYPKYEIVLLRNLNHVNINRGSFKLRRKIDCLMDGLEVVDVDVNLNEIKSIYSDEDVCVEFLVDFIKEESEDNVKKHADEIMGLPYYLNLPKGEMYVRSVELLNNDKAELLTKIYADNFINYIEKSSKSIYTDIKKALLCVKYNAKNPDKVLNNLLSVMETFLIDRAYIAKIMLENIGELSLNLDKVLNERLLNKIKNNEESYSAKEVKSLKFDFKNEDINSFSDSENERKKDIVEKIYSILSTIANEEGCMVTSNKYDEGGEYILIMVSDKEMNVDLINNVFKSAINYYRNKSLLSDSGIQSVIKTLINKEKIELMQLGEKKVNKRKL